jgi:predicted TIM-barrel fold metal-dependent hydrolase
MAQPQALLADLRRRGTHEPADRPARGRPVGGTPSASGWPSFYVEEHQVLSHSMPIQAACLILEGVFDRYPKLKIILIEGGFA